MNSFMMMASALLTWVFLLGDIVAFIAFLVTENTGYSSDFNFTWWMMLGTLIWCTSMACVSWTCCRYLEQQVAKDNAENGEGNGEVTARSKIQAMWDYIF